MKLRKQPHPAIPRILPVAGAMATLTPNATHPISGLVAAHRLDGYAVPTHRFVVQESRFQVCSQALMSLYFGFCVALVVRDFITAHEARALSVGFTHAATNERTDGVPAQGLGASHYDKSSAGYFDEVARTRDSVQKACAHAQIDLSARLVGALRDALDPGLSLRPAHWQGRPAPALRAAAWANKQGDYALRPHDDVQQLHLPEQHDFEVQDVLGPVAANIYTSMPQEGGLLRVWNVQPLPETKKRLGVQRTGYPYDEQLLRGVASVDIDPRPGDLVLLNGAFVHAVTGWPGAAQARLVWNGFTGLLRDKSAALYWT